MRINCAGNIDMSGTSCVLLKELISFRSILHDFSLSEFCYTIKPKTPKAKIIKLNPINQ